MCVQVPCVYLLYTASAVTVQNTKLFFLHARFQPRMTGLMYSLGHITQSTLNLKISKNSMFFYRELSYSHEMWDSYLPKGGWINIYMLHVYAVTTVVWSPLSVDTCLYHTVPKASTDFLISLACNRCNLINSEHFQNHLKLAAVIPPSDLEIHWS